MKKLALITLLMIFTWPTSIISGQSNVPEDCNQSNLSSEVQSASDAIARLESLLGDVKDAEAILEELNAIEDSVNAIRSACSTSSNTYGEEVDGFLYANEVSEHTFEGQAGDIVTISVYRESGEADLAIDLYGPDGSLLMSDDDSNPDGIFNPQITDLPLREDGEYRIVVTRCSFCDESDSASYRLLVTTSDNNGDVQNTTIITYGDTVEGFLYANETSRHFFSGNTGDVVTISATREGGTADIALELYDPGGRLLFSDDDSNPDGILNPMIAEIPLRETGDYTIVVTRCSFCDEADSARYVLRLTSQ